MKCKALPDSVLAHNIQRGQRMLHGILLLDDNCKDHGIRPRWMQVYDVGSDVNDIKVGDWILVTHGRWSRAFKIPKTNDPTSINDLEDIHKVDVEHILGVYSGEGEPEDATVYDTQKY